MPRWRAISARRSCSTQTVGTDENGVPTITYWGLGEIAVGADGRPYGVADPSAIWSRNGRYYMLTGNLLVLRKYGLEQGRSEHKADTTYLFVSKDLD